MASNIQQLITNLEETIAYLKTQLPKEEVVVKVDKKKTTAKKEPVEKKEPAEKKAEPKAKNLSRFTPAMKTELTKVLKAHNVELTEDLRKKFIDHINGLEAEDYMKVNLTAHMEQFAKENSTEEEAEPQQAAGFVSPFVGEDSPPNLESLSNANGYNMSQLTRHVSSDQLKELKKTEILKSLNNGNYWHAKTGMWVFENGDEDIDEIEFEGDTYGVNKVNKRVYETVNDKDVFVGFIGIGRFRKMKV